MTGKSLVLVIIGVITVAGLVTYAISNRKHAMVVSTETVQTNSQIIRYLPLGDSYTIGESVAEAERWPNQLAETYAPAGKRLHIVANPAVTGYTTQDLINTELPLVKRLKPDFVTVLIGVNDYVQGVSAQAFQQNLNQIINELQQQMTQPHNVLLVTIPDYAKTPTGARFGKPAASTAGIESFNRIIIDIAAQAKLPVADIFSVSQQVSNDRQLTAGDGLHPSGKQYQSWAAIIQRSLEAADVPR